MIPNLVPRRLGRRRISRGAKFFEKRAASADTLAAQAAWEKVGDQAPMAGDHWTKPLRKRAT
ncbi:MAG: hypothetical protein EB007_08440 [Betaproteobacteria bacterium]|nr:hypothetical protein [Betaproteobacteria bacterium]